MTIAPVQFRTAGPEDIPVIQQIAYETWPVTFGPVMPRQQIDYMLALIYNENALRDQMQAKGHQFILVVQEGHPLGFTSYETRYNPEPQLMIHKLYLLPASQGLRIGTRLLQWLAGTARDQHLSILRLKVYFENTRAIAFYEKNGFTKTGTETTDIGNNYHILDHVMVKELAGIP